MPRGLAQHTSMAELASCLGRTLPTSVPLANFPCGLRPTLWGWAAPWIDKAGSPQPWLLSHCCQPNIWLPTVPGQRHCLTKQLIPKPCLAGTSHARRVRIAMYTARGEASFGSKCTATAMYVANAKDQLATVATENFFFFPSPSSPPSASQRPTPTPLGVGPPGQHTCPT